MCRTLYGSILFALQMARSVERALYGEALARLAELRLAQGRIEAAERWSRASGITSRSRALSAPSIWCGAKQTPQTPSPAAASEVGDGRLESALLLELHAESQLRRGDIGGGVATAHRLVGLGTDLGCEAVAARGERVLGAALAAAGDVVTARVHLDAAIASFARLQMALEGGRAHLLLAGALVEEGPDTAVAEAQSALAVFEELGAGLNAALAAALLRALGAKASRTGGRGIGLLTKRETEVLALLGEGLQNREIGQRLYLTTKTVEHHVARLRSKLNLRTRAEAAASRPDTSNGIESGIRWFCRWQLRRRLPLSVHADKGRTDGEGDVHTAAA